MREVRRQLAALTILQQQSITMVYYDNLTHKERAERLGIPLPTFKTRLRDGLSQLRALQSHTENVPASSGRPRDRSTQRRSLPRFALDRQRHNPAHEPMYG
ncbi:sigma factor-like helix-turn-helix DNA-binding protein [Microbispora sp. NRRL B-24597]|uniref:sigma factor-like helix-turn-helix DNA-binding protein n=1 Tax=Microbispora sp. NRRL B-24597 TaxID=1463823 RepID=UPI00336A01DD